MHLSSSAPNRGVRAARVRLAVPRGEKAALWFWNHRVGQEPLQDHCAGISHLEFSSENIAKGTTDPRIEFILQKKLLEVISQILITFYLQNPD